MSKSAKGFVRFAGVGLPLAAVLVMGGCANMPTNGGGGYNNMAANNGQPQSGNQSGCSAAESGVVGALIGGLVGAATHGERGALIGAVAGGAVGAAGCALYNAHYQSQQIASAQAVNNSYTQTHGTLPVHSTVVSYSTAIRPGATVVMGSQAQVESKLTVVQGRDAPLPKVAEHVVMFAPNGHRLTEFTRQATAVDGSGEYQTSIAFPMPKGAVLGRYTIQTTAILNGKPVRTNTVSMVVVA